MSESKDSEKLKVTEQSRSENKIIKRLLAILREALSVLFWVYVITKVFVFDIDIFLVNRLSPNYAWLVNYKFFILIGVIAVVWLVTKNKHIVLWMLFVFFYPLIFLFWRIPHFLFKQKSWILVFALIDAVISFFKSLKFTFITTSFFLVSTAIIFGFSNEILMWFAITALIIILLAVYIQRLSLVFKPSGVYQIYGSFFSHFEELVSTSPTYTVDENLASLPIGSMDEKQIEKWTVSVQALVLYNRVCLFTSKKLKAYQGSGFNIVSSIMVILLLVAFTVLSFSIVNLGLFKINHDFYSFSTIPTFFNFFYYSFNILLFNPIQDIVAITPMSQVASMVESFFALFLVAIFVSLILSVRSQRDADELNGVIKGLREDGIKMEGFIKDKYKLNNIEEAMDALKKLQAAFTDFLYKITEGID